MSNILNEDKNTKDYNEMKFDSFINKTIILSSKDYFRKQMKNVSREKTIFDDENYEIFLQEYISLGKNDDFSDTIENQLELHNALKSLTAIEQSVISLLFQKELSRDEAAKILKIYSQSVTRIKIRAVRKLRDHFKGDFGDEQ